VNSNSINLLNTHDERSVSIEESNSFKKSTFTKDWTEDKLSISLEANNKLEDELNLNIEPKY
jgi:hypothetical protein